MVVNLNPVVGYMYHSSKSLLLPLVPALRRKAPILPKGNIKRGLHKSLYTVMQENQTKHETYHNMKLGQNKIDQGTVKKVTLCSVD
jgi:hypothetical protein